MAQGIVIVDVEFHGYDGFVDVELPASVTVVSPAHERGLLARLGWNRRRHNGVTCAIFSPPLSPDADDRTVMEFYKVGTPSDWVLYLHSVEKWEPVTDGVNRLQQVCGIATVVRGKVTGLYPGDAYLILDCGVDLTVSTSDMQGALPPVGESITVKGDLLLFDELCQMQLVQDL